LVREAEIAKDHGTRWICRPDIGAPVQNAAGLVEVDSFGNVRRDKRIILSIFRDAVDLDGQSNRYAIAQEFAGERNRSRSTPAVAEQDDTGASFFFVCELAVSFPVQPIEDQFVGVCDPAIFEYLNMNVVAVSSLNLLSYLHLCMAKVVAMDETSYKTNNKCR